MSGQKATFRAREVVSRRSAGVESQLSRPSRWPNVSGALLSNSKNASLVEQKMRVEGGA